jgi:cation diffusion facilitator CzcD-associated flavoprotein CzcO
MGAHLKAAGVKHRVLGEPMEAWREKMPVGMHLKSDPIASNLFDPESRWTLERFYAERGERFMPRGAVVPIETFSAYGQWFQEKAVPDLEKRKVTILAAAPDGFALTLDDGERFTARRVVVASGLTDFAFTPPELNGLPPSLLSHSEAHKAVDTFKGRDVTVLGAGASAIDLATLMHEAGVRVRMVARRPELEFHATPRLPRPLLEQILRPDSDLGPGWRAVFYTRWQPAFSYLPADFRHHAVKTAFGPSAGWTMRDRFQGKVPALYCRTLKSATPGDGGLELTFETAPGQRETIHTEHLVAATGYRVNLRKLSFLAPALVDRIALDGTMPRLSDRFESSVPGLYFSGLAAANRFGPSMRFACGAKFATVRIAAALR